MSYLMLMLLERAVLDFLIGVRLGSDCGLAEPWWTVSLMADGGSSWPGEFWRCGRRMQGERPDRAPAGS